MGILLDFLRWLPRYFFPKICYGCGQEGSFVCPACRPTVNRVLEDPLCPVCLTASPLGATHPNCRRRHRLDGLTSYYRYDGWAKSIVQAAKFGTSRYFRGMLEFADEFAGALATSPGGIFLNKGIHSHDWTIIPIPLHWWRERKRGYNQAAMIADRLSQRLGLPRAEHLLQRTRYTTAQTLATASLSLPPAALDKLDRTYPSELARDQAYRRLLKQQKDTLRRDNVAGAFAVRPRSTLPSRVLLVDDVWTTGATMRECSKVLKRAGVKTVWGVTLLRA